MGWHTFSTKCERVSDFNVVGCRISVARTQLCRCNSQAASPICEQVVGLQGFLKILLQLIYNALSISSVQQSDPAIHIYTFFFVFMFHHT